MLIIVICFIYVFICITYEHYEFYKISELERMCEESRRMSEKERRLKDEERRLKEKIKK